MEEAGNLRELEEAKGDMKEETREVGEHMQRAKWTVQRHVCRIVLECAKMRVLPCKMGSLSLG